MKRAQCMLPKNYLTLQHLYSLVLPLIKTTRVKQLQKLVRCTMNQQRRHYFVLLKKEKRKVAEQLQAYLCLRQML